MPKDLSANITTEITTEEHRPIELYIATLDDYVSYAQSTPFLRKWGSSGSGDGEFNEPRGITIHNNEVYVCDRSNHRIQIFDTVGTYKRQWAMETYYVNKIAIYNNEAYVVYRSIAGVYVYDLNGNLQRSWGGTNSFLNGITVYNDEVYLSDTNAYSVKVFDLNGNLQRSWGDTYGGIFTTPRGITVYNDEVYVVDSGDFSVKVFNTIGTLQREWGSYGSGDGEFGSLEEAKIYNDEVYVSDTGNNRIQVFDLQGNFLRKWGSSGSGDGEFNEPRGITIHNNEVYVVEEDGNRVQVFEIMSYYTPTYHDQILYLTDHDQDIDFYNLDGNPQTYTAAAISRGQVKTNIDNHIDSVTVHLDNINRAMTDYIATYKFRGRRMVVWRVYEDYLTDSDDYITIFDGVMDKPAITEGSMEIVVKSRLGTLVKKVPRRIYQVHCNWEFGGTECTINKFIIETMIVNATVTAGSATNVIVIAGASYESLAVDYYKFGSVIFTAGDNNKETRSITYSKGSLANYGVQGVELGLAYSLDYDPAGDTATIQQGCDKTPTTCENKYNNLVNYGGFTTVPQLMIRR